MKKRQFATSAIHAGEGCDPTTGAVCSPLYQTVTYGYSSTEEYDNALAGIPWGDFFYSREANPNARMLEKKIAELEGAEISVVLPSGMAAVSLAVLAAVKSGDHILVNHEMFINSRQFFENDCPEFGIEVTWVDAEDIEAMQAAVKINTKIIYIEAVTNPETTVLDLNAISKFAVNNKLMFIVDNTFMTPYLIRPLEFGADVVLHSSTKYLNGHGDALGGVVSGKKEFILSVTKKMITLGAAASPFNSWLTLRGVRSLPIRMQRHCENAMALAKFLEMHEEVDWVMYPGLESHPHHHRAKKFLTNGFGGMLQYVLKGGKERGIKLANALKVCTIATSFGDLNTLIRFDSESGETRMSVGCEDIKDLIADFNQAFGQL